MSAITTWMKSLGAAGAVVNARLETDRSALADRAIDDVVGRLPAGDRDRRQSAA
ncbi:MAG: hypothetical protein ACLFRV_14145 [Acidimicrobiales bacterium]